MPLAPSQVHTFRLLYRKIIKLHQNWAVDDDHFLRMVSYTRTQFEAIEASYDPKQRANALAAHERWLEECKHPDPYIPVQQQGGPMFQRNVPPPYELLQPPAHLNSPESVRGD